MPLSDLQLRSDVVRMPAIRMAFAFSLVLHVLVTLLFSLSWMRRETPEPPQGEGREAIRGQLRTRIAPQAAPPAAPAAPAEPRRAAREARRPAVAERAPTQRAAPARASPAVPGAAARLEGASPAPAPPTPPAPAAPAPAAAPSAPADFSDLVAANKRARGAAPGAAAEAAPASGDGEAARRATAAAMANLSSIRAPSPGESNRRGGGVFEVRRPMGIEEAEFLFFGWNKDMRRNNTQSIIVRKGSNPSIELAVVRRMIGIIRDHEQGDFTWHSTRQGRSMTLSARQRDNDALEAFMMQEFFY